MSTKLQTPAKSTVQDSPTKASETNTWPQLIRRAKAGCDRSFEEIIEQLYSYLILTAGTRIQGGLKGKFGASDIVQSGLIRAYTGLNTFEGSTEAELRGWVKAIVLNSLNDQNRRYSSKKRNIDLELELGELAEQTLYDESTPSDLAVQNEERVLLQRYVAELPPLEQRVVEMHHRFGYSLAEISEILDLSYSKVRYAWKSGIAKLKKWAGAREAVQSGCP